METITPTPSQQTAINSFVKFLDGPAQVFLLKGAAGTGKTTVIKEFVKHLDSLNRQCVLLAPTGRAAFIIGNKIGREASTIHRCIYKLRQVQVRSQNKETEDDGLLFSKFGLRNNGLSDSTVYIIDESAMISDSFSEGEAFTFGSGRLLADLFEFVCGRKIVFVGDYAQLPPVGMYFSPALDKEYIEQTYDCKVTESYLHEVLRQQSGSVILDNANRIRDGIDAKNFIEFGLRNGDDCQTEDTSLLMSYYALSESKPDIHSVIIAYSNRQALEYNVAIRCHYFGVEAPRLKAGDLLMVARNNYAYEVELFNGNIVVVESCDVDEEVETRIVRVKLSKDRIESIELRFRRVVVKFNAGGNVEFVTVRLLDNFLDDSHPSVGGLVSRALIVDFENRVPQFIKEQLPIIKKLLRKGDKLTIEQQEIYAKYVDMLWHDPYYNALICKYGYAMTCHKAQGGEWPNVFVDMGRYGDTANEDYFRWAYTAITRASKKLWHFRSPDFNYISNLVVEPIQKSENIKVSTYSENSDFCEDRFERIKALAAIAGLSVSEDKSISYQHRISFTDVEGRKAMFSLWYNRKGYSNKDILLSSAGDELTGLSKTILEASYVPQNVPFEDAGRPFAEKLVNFMRAQFAEIGIELLDITQEHYQDIFHLKTDGYAKVILYYTDKGNYTYMKLISSLGQDDEKLTMLRQRFI